MSSPFLPRMAIRQTRVLVQRRAASNTSEAVSSGAAKAKEAAQDTAAKAQQGLSRVSTTASSALSNAASTASSTISSIGGRTGQVISFVQSLIPPTLYYARVGGELAKIVYQGRGMQPPTMQTVQSYLNSASHAVRNPSALASKGAQVAEKTTDAALNNPQSFLVRLRNLDHATLATVGVVAAETIGFFSVGEMIGRFKIVGYRGEVHSHH